jgi:hypothetical protein
LEDCILILLFAVRDVKTLGFAAFLRLAAMVFEIDIKQQFCPKPQLVFERAGFSIRAAFWFRADRLKLLRRLRHPAQSAVLLQERKGGEGALHDRISIRIHWAHGTPTDLPFLIASVGPSSFDADD